MRRLLAAVAVLAALWHAAPASASWAATAQGASRGRAISLTTPIAPTVARIGNSTNFRITWAAVTDSNGAEVLAYRVNRHRISDGAITTACTSVPPTRTCNDGTIPSTGSYRYSLTAIKGWTSDGPQTASNYQR